MLVGCVIAWAYQTHPEAFQDVIADFNHDPNGARTLLAQSQKECADLTTVNAALESDNGALKENLRSLSDQVAQLKAVALGTTAPGTAPTTLDAGVTPATFIPPSPLPAQANWTWTTTDGKTYKNVVIIKVEADCVTILDDEGGARIYTVTLPPDIQKLLNYNSSLARTAGEARVKDEINNQIALNAEKQRVQQQLKSEAATDQKTVLTLSGADAQILQQKIQTLQSDIREKLREIAQDFRNDDYSRNTSHSAYEDIVTQEAQQVCDLQTKLNEPATPLPVYYPYYPYYYYYLP